ncbi:MAG: YeeE/YedE family protein [Betaproteobacteria bacterium]|nr:YeeE/YedE family protein [Betaproteobacteria bacterium]
MIDASWGYALTGGALIGLASGGLMLLNGRIAGISGVFHRAVEGSRDGWRWAFLAGLLLAGAVAHFVAPARLPVSGSGSSIVVAIIAGLLVGIGTRMGSGCTSGHGICGLARMSPRSLAAVLVFLATGMLVTAAVGWLGRAQ